MHVWVPRGVRTRGGKNEGSQQADVGQVDFPKPWRSISGGVFVEFLPVISMAVKRTRGLFTER